MASIGCNSETSVTIDQPCVPTVEDDTNRGVETSVSTNTNCVRTLEDGSHRL